MKKLLIEYFNMIGFAITGIVFGISFFLILINCYHYKDVNSTYIKQDSDYKINNEMKNKLEKINQNISIFDPNTYHGNEDIYSMSSIKSRLQMCVTKINTEEFNRILEQKEINIKDIYDMQQFYQISISNECLVKQIYEISNNTENSKIKISSLNQISPFLEDNIEELITSTDYLQKVIKNNSSYSFSSNSSKIDIYDQTKDSYYSLLNNYSSAIDYIYDLSVWYKGVIE